MGAGIHEWCVYIKNGKVYVGLISFIGDSPDEGYPTMAIVKRFWSEDDSDEKEAKAYAYDFAMQAKLPLGFDDSQ